MKHELKIKQCYLIHILEGRKPFESRKNDRDFQVGDTIRFLPLEAENGDAYTISRRPIPDYIIDYVLSDFYGLQPHYVALTIRPMFEHIDIDLEGLINGDRDKK